MLCVCREFWTFDQLKSSYQIWAAFIFVHQKSLKRTFKTSFWVQNQLFVLKNLVWNVLIKAFWYTNLVVLIIILQALMLNNNQEKCMKISLITSLAMLSAVTQGYLSKVFQTYKYSSHWYSMARNSRCVQGILSL